VSVRVANIIVGTVCIHTAFGVTDSILIRYLTGQWTRLIGAVYGCRPVAHRSQRIVDLRVKFKGVVWTSVCHLWPGSAWSAFKQANVYASMVTRLAFPETTAIGGMRKIIWFSVQVYPVLAFLPRRTVWSRANLWQTLLLARGEGGEQVH